jgi:ribosomal protein S18 acetylase RimI-like enzyme
MNADYLRIALRFRLARVEDAADIARIDVRSWQAAYRAILPREYLDKLSIPKRQAQWRETIKAGTPRVILAQRDDVTLGYVAWGRSRDRDRHGAEAEIETLYIDPMHWRKGAGTLLIDESIEAAASEGYRDITLWVLEENERALSFYRARGFRLDGAFHSLTIGGRLVDEMRLRLKIQ